MSVAPSPGEWLSPSQAANRLGLSGQQVRRLADDGKLTSQTTALGRLIAADSVEALRQERAEKEAHRG